ncbi:DUF4377 domain-containing protein [Cochleicola gelatinilyticus]|uniref:DUF4377 domain-containing protein n=1 Tax=Cochleicola gelatinilyticus TaxID=1763537 RepID=A0A167H2N3_9FLAO|nr:DUF4377 domain-containing protein [Cochleicola gelatinilyticus]OAB78151.1 hypothetical protein ULVI_11760 [Cochleicola gelatinilyticus]
MKSLTALFLAFLIANSCNEKPSEEQETFVYWVNSAKVACEGVGQRQCLQIQKGEQFREGEWQLFYSTIDGFNYEPGFIYKLEVSEVKKDPKSVPADASSIQYTLVEVLEKKAMEPKTDSKIAIQLHDIWALQAMNGDVVRHNQFSGRNKQPVLEIFVEEKRIGGNDGCNSIFGSIETLTDKSIRFGTLGGTKMACPNMDLSAEYNKALQQVRSYKREELSLYFYNEADKEVLRYKKVD